MLQVNGWLEVAVNVAQDDSELSKVWIPVRHKALPMFIAITSTSEEVNIQCDVIFFCKGLHSRSKFIKFTTRSVVSLCSSVK